MSVRVRFAPSPTGPLHLGNARTAVLNELFRIKNRAKFILRIEDTDPERFDGKSESMIINELSWLGIVPDEGPPFGGDVGPYRQSERRDIYVELAERLIAEGRAYRCFCTDEELEAERKNAISRGIAPRYSGKCRNLSQSEFSSHEGKPYTIRFKANNSEIRVKDLIHKEITFPPDTFDDFIILRSDRSAVYNFSSAVDDHLMGITHIIRGEDHLPNTPRQVMIYEALGIDPPTFAHHPLLLTPTGEKISKRDKGMNLEDLIGDGYTPEAVFNYLASLGNPNPSGNKIITAEEIAKNFDIERLGRGTIKMNPEDIERISARHIRSLGTGDLEGRLAPILKSHGYKTEKYDSSYLSGFADAVRDNISTLMEALIYAPIFFGEDPMPDDDAKKILKDKDSKKVLGAALNELETINKLDLDGWRNVTKRAIDLTNIKGKAFFSPLRAAMTGMVTGPELEKVAVIIGIDKVRERLSRFVKG